MHETRRESRFRALIDALSKDNAFYRAKFLDHGVQGPASLDQLAEFPFTTKDELLADQAAHHPYGTNLTLPIDSYTRLHRTSGTSGRPLRWLDDAASWSWLLDCWDAIYGAAGVTAADRVFVAFSFGPFLGFWGAFESAQRLGCLTLSGGGSSTAQRVDAMLVHEPTVLVCTPTYALRLGAEAVARGTDLAAGPLRVTIHAGEPGASVPNVRARLERLFGACVVDHVGATEVGAWGYGCDEPGNVHVLHPEFVAEVIDPETTAPAAAAKGARRGELVLTNLGRIASPVLRYRTGDLVEEIVGGCPCGREGVVLRGGVLGRLDDMFIVRGMNIYPSAVEDVVRGFDDIDEFEIVLSERAEMAELTLRVEASSGATPRALEDAVHHRLHVRPRVELVDAGSLPRYELKARRFRRE